MPYAIHVPSKDLNPSILERHLCCRAVVILAPGAKGLESRSHSTQSRASCDAAV